MNDVVAVGVFDGVHCGHCQILKGAKRVITFSIHPRAVLAPASAPLAICSLEKRLRLIRASGIEDIQVLDIVNHPELLEMDREAFVRDYLCGATVRCGVNWRFGHRAAGTPFWLRDRGYPVEIVQSALYAGESVSSSRIRAAVSAGEMSAADAMLGRKFKMEGLVFSGKGLARTQGWATVNLQPRPENTVCPPLGVYATELLGCKAVMSWGVAPTMAEKAWKKPVMELHFLDRLPEIEPNANMEVEFRHFIRPEQKFSSLSALSEQIKQDIVAAKAYLGC